MSETSQELPDAIGGVDGESDVIAERAGCDTPRSRRPVHADPPDKQDPPGTRERSEQGEKPDDEEDDEDEEEDVIRSDAETG
ncbi:hypothetical protein AB0I81_35335 [Nonomuraea sp. NPDC050404]|uniref:hypothetical protein n=1 Tax=Nonomuraea sp. NPDC050404 TaxID=3155783 RepID=UPI0033CC5210